MRQPRRMVAILSVSAVAIISACAGNPKPNTVDPVTVSSTTRGTPVPPNVQPSAAAETGASTQPADKGPLTLETAVRRAVSYHPSVVEAVSRLNQQGEALNEARAGYRPRLSWGVNTDFDSGAGDYRPSLEVSGSQMIYDFGKVANEVEARRANERVSRAELLLGIDQLVRDTATAVIETNRFQALAAVAEEQLAGVQSIARLVRQRSDHGASTRSDEVQADARVAAAESALFEINSQLERWRTGLANLTGKSGQLVVSGEMPGWLGQACNIMHPDWSQSPAILRAQSEAERARALSDLSRVQALPTLSVEAGGSYAIANRHIGSALDSDPHEFSVGLNLKGNLYDGGAAAASRRAATEALASAEAAIRRSRVEISGSLLQAQSQIGNLQRMVATLESRGDMMKRTRDLYRHQYVELGTRTLLDLLNAEQELHQAAFDRVNATYDAWRLNVDCLYNSGRTRRAFGLDAASIRGMELRL